MANTSIIVSSRIVLLSWRKVIPILPVVVLRTVNCC